MSGENANLYEHYEDLVHTLFGALEDAQQQVLISVSKAFYVAANSYSDQGLNVEAPVALLLDQYFDGLGKREYYIMGFIPHRATYRVKQKLELRVSSEDGIAEQPAYVDTALLKTIYEALPEDSHLKRQLNQQGYAQDLEKAAQSEDALKDARDMHTIAREIATARQASVTSLQERLTHLEELLDHADVANRQLSMERDAFAEKFNAADVELQALQQDFTRKLSEKTSIFSKTSKETEYRALIQSVAEQKDRHTRQLAEYRTRIDTLEKKCREQANKIRCLEHQVATQEASANQQRREVEIQLHKLQSASKRFLLNWYVPGKEELAQHAQEMEAIAQAIKEAKESHESALGAIARLEQAKHGVELDVAAGNLHVVTNERLVGHVKALALPGLALAVKVSSELLVQRLKKLECAIERAWFINWYSWKHPSTILLKAYVSSLRSNLENLLERCSHGYDERDVKGQLEIVKTLRSILLGEQIKGLKSRFGGYVEKALSEVTSTINDLSTESVLLDQDLKTPPANDGFDFIANLAGRSLGVAKRLALTTSEGADRTHSMMEKVKRSIANMFGRQITAGQVPQQAHAFCRATVGQPLTLSPPPHQQQAMLVGAH